MLKLRTFGGLALLPQDGTLTGAATQRRPLALLAILAVASERGVGRERLQALLWPESDETRARRVLAQTLYALRRDLGNAGLILGTAELRLNTVLVSADVTEFECAVGAGRLERAATLYQAPFLDSVYLTDAPEFTEWVEAERGRLAVVARQSLERLAREAAERGDIEVSVGWWRRLAALDPLNGRVAAGLMQALGASGDAAAALRHARIHETLLREELGAAPDPAVTALAERLRTPDKPERVITAAAPLRRDTLGPAPNVTLPSMPDAPTPPPMARETAQLSDDSAESLQSTRRRRATLGLGVAGVLMAGAVAALLLRSQGDTYPAPDEDAVVVVPFDVPDPELRLWREGMVDVLSRNLDGAGPLRTVSPTLVVRDWKGRADRETVRAFARAAGAGTALFGQLLHAGTDSVRASATLLNVSTGQPIAEFRRQEADNRMDRLTDSLTVDILRAVGPSVPLGASRAAPLGAVTSFEALHAFLQGEQFYRRAAWDSAVRAYHRAVAIDTTFALAWRRLGLVASWQRLLQDSLTAAYLLRAGVNNHGLGARDSLLVAGDSLSAAASITTSASEASRLTKQLFATLDSAASRYPADPEVWFALGEARYHFGFGPSVGVSERLTLDAFGRAIALDSAFAPAYIHAVELGFNVGGGALGLRYARAYLARSPTEAAHRGVLLVEPLVDPARAGSAETARLLDTARTSALVSARTIFRRWPDSAEAAVRLSRLLAAGRSSEYALFADTGFMRRRLAEQLAFRGYLDEAARVLGDRDVPLRAELAYLGALDADDVRATFARWRAAELPLTRLTLPWLAAEHDTVSLAALARRAAARLAAPGVNPDARTAASYDTAAALAHLALARGDTTAALGRFTALPDALCSDCYLHRLVRARLQLARGQLREARLTLGEPLAAFLTPVEVAFAAERARVAAALGNRADAAAACAFVRAAWARASSVVWTRIASACTPR